MAENIGAVASISPAFNGKRHPTDCGAHMRAATGHTSRLRLAIAAGVPSSQLSALLAMQRTEEPTIALDFFEASTDELFAGLHDGRYDVGMALQQSTDPALRSLPLWSENMAVALPRQNPLTVQEQITLADLLAYPVFCWPAEICSLLGQPLPLLQATNRKCIQQVKSFEMMALWVSAGYGLGLSAQSRIEHARGWGISMRPLSDGPYEEFIFSAVEHQRLQPRGIVRHPGHGKLQIDLDRESRRSPQCGHRRFFAEAGLRPTGRSSSPG